MINMTSKERVHAALAREPVDRVPIFMWFHPDTAVHLSQLLEIPVEFVGDAMGNDVKQTWVNNNYAMEGITHEHQGDWHVDYWGIKWVKGGAYNQIGTFPLEHASREEILDYKFPVQKMEELLGQMDPVVQDSGESFIGCDVSPCVFEMYNRLRGMENAMIDLLSDPELAYEMQGRCADFAIQLAEQSCDRFPLDWLWTGDDVASQQSMLMSPKTWRELIKPHLQRVIDVGKSRNLWVAYHCCGSLYPIIPDLIDMGVDVLNPVQCNCPNMDPVELKKEFGKHIAFMGGVDNMHVIPYGTADDVRRATARLLEAMTADGGGYILAASHTIPPETPDENIFAMYEVAGRSREEIFDHAADIRARIS